MGISEYVGHDREIEQCVAALNRGTHVSVVGHHLSGKSRFVSRVREILISQGWTTLEISGTRTLKASPLLHIQTCVPGEELNGRNLSVDSAILRVRDYLRDTPALLIVDNVEYLDDASWGVIQIAVKQQNISLLTTTGLSATENNRPLEGMSVQLTLGPLGVEAMEAVLTKRLEGTLEMSVFRAVFSDSGGLVGLACAIVEAGLISGALERAESGLWAAKDGLWTPLLQSTVDEYLVDLDANERKVLESLAQGGFTELDEVAKVVGWEVLDRLEQRGLIEVVFDSGRRMLTVFPPLLVQATRASQHRVLRAELSEYGVARVDHEWTEDGSSLGPEAEAPAPEPANLRLFHERVHAHLEVAQEQWLQDPGAAQATRYVRALLAANAAPADIDAAFLATEAGQGLPLDRARYAQLRAEWSALSQHDLPLAQEILAEAAAGSLDGYERMLEATGVRLQTLLVGVPDDFASRLHTDDALPIEVNDSLLESQALAFLALGRLGEARRAFAAMSDEYLAAVGSPANYLFGYLLLVEGSFAEGLRWAETGLLAAIDNSDADAMFNHAYVLSLGLACEGDYGRCKDIFAWVFSVAEPSALLGHTHVALRVLGAMVSMRRGNHSVARRIIQGIQRLGIETGPLLGHQLALATAQIEAFDANSQSAIENLWEDGEKNWARGYRFVAAQQFLLNAEISALPQSLDEVRGYMAEIEGGFLGNVLAFLEAREAADAAQLLALVPQLMSSGRPGLGVKAVQLALSISRQNQDPATENEALGVRRKLENDDRWGHPIDVRRFFTEAVRLTEREGEIAQLIAGGQANPDIAAQLFLSLRTVEKHINSIMKKTQSANREELISFIRNRRLWIHEDRRVSRDSE